MNLDHLHSALSSSNSGDKTPYGGLNQPPLCRLSTIWPPVSTVNTKLSLERDLGSPHAAAPPLLEATVDAGTWLTGLIRFGAHAGETGLGYVLAIPKSQQVPHLGRIDHLFSQALQRSMGATFVRGRPEGPARPSLGGPADHVHRGLRRRDAHPPAVGAGPPQHRRARGERLLPRLGAAGHGACLPGRHSCRRSGKRGRKGSCLAPRTVTEVRRPLATVPSPTAVGPSLISMRAPRWSHWRRRRQAVARRCH